MFKIVVMTSLFIVMSGHPPRDCQVHYDILDLQQLGK